jgi:hypothetical protein
MKEALRESENDDIQRNLIMGFEALSCIIMKPRNSKESFDGCRLVLKA